MNVPYGASSCLYNGIMDRIDWVKKKIESDMESNRKDYRNIVERDYKAVIEAVDFYMEHCVLSGKYLVDALELLTRDYEAYVSR